MAQTKFKLSQSLIIKLKKFEDALEDYHEIKFFRQNENYCPYYKANLFYSEFEQKWSTDNKLTLAQNYEKTGHICCIKPIYNEVKKFKPIEKGRMLGEPLSLSFLFFLEIIQSSAVVGWIAQNTFLNRNNEEKFINRLIDGDPIAETILGRILTFYDNFVNLEVKMIHNKTKKEDKKDFLINELPALPSVPIPKTKNIKDDGAYIPKNDESFKTIWHFPWQLIVPPISWMDELKSADYPEMLEWNFFRKTSVKNAIFKSNEINPIEIKNLFFPYLEMNYSNIEAVIDKRIEKKEQADITIFYKFF